MTVTWVRIILPVFQKIVLEWLSACCISVNIQDEAEVDVAASGMVDWGRLIDGSCTKDYE